MIKANKQIVDVLNKLFEEVAPVVVEEGKKAIDEIVQNTKEQVNEFIEQLNTEKVKNVDFREVKLLNSSKLITLAKEILLLELMRFMFGRKLIKAVCISIWLMVKTKNCWRKTRISLLF